MIPLPPPIRKITKIDLAVLNARRAGIAAQPNAVRLLQFLPEVLESSILSPMRLARLNGRNGKCIAIGRRQRLRPNVMGVPPTCRGNSSLTLPGVRRTEARSGAAVSLTSVYREMNANRVHEARADRGAFQQRRYSAGGLNQSPRAEPLCLPRTGKLSFYFYF